MESQLSALTKRIVTAYQSYRDDEARRVALQETARKYQVHPPEVLLSITDTRLRSMPLGERCKELGITEEEFLAAAMTPEFRKFTEDFEAMNHAILRISAQEKLARAIPKDRYDADEVEKYDIEMALIKQPPQQVQNVQVNNYNTLFDKARSELLSAPTTELVAFYDDETPA